MKSFESCVKCQMSNVKTSQGESFFVARTIAYHHEHPFNLRFIE